MLFLVTSAGAAYAVDAEVQVEARHFVLRCKAAVVRIVVVVVASVQVCDTERLLHAPPMRYQAVDGNLRGSDSGITVVASLGASKALLLRLALGGLDARRLAALKFGRC